MIGRAWAILATGLALTAPAAQAAECRLALLLALDVSSSVDATEDALQRGGLAAALIAPEVQDAFFAAPLPVALAIYEWSGRYKQHVILDWTTIDGPEDLVTAAETVAASRRSYSEFPTAMGYALGYGAGMLQRGPRCLFQVLDMAGDGVNNEGFPPAAAYAEFPFDGVVVNGLVIAARTDDPLVGYYEREVMRGPGSFVEAAEGFEDFERAMRRKLEREVTPRAVGTLGPGNGPG